MLRCDIADYSEPVAESDETVNVDSTIIPPFPRSLLKKTFTGNAVNYDNRHWTAKSGIFLLARGFFFGFLRCFLFFRIQSRFFLVFLIAFLRFTHEFGSKIISMVFFSNTGNWCRYADVWAVARRSRLAASTLILLYGKTDASCFRYCRILCLYNSICKQIIASYCDFDSVLAMKRTTFSAGRGWLK